MIKEEFKQKVNQVYLEFCKDPNCLSLGGYDANLWLFASIFNTRPYAAYLDGTDKDIATLIENDGFTKEEIKEYNLNSDTIDWNIKDVYPLIIEKGLDTRVTSDNIIKEYIKDGIFISTDIFITEEFLFSNTGYVFFKDHIIPERFSKCFTKYNKQDKYFGYVSCGQRGFKTTQMKIKDLATEENFLDNYNDDFPWDKLVEFVNSDESGLALMFGIPGSGKSSAIRHLISTNDDVNFFWLDQGMLSQVNNSDFLDFLLDHKNSVFILEDCDILIQSRDKGGNGLINSLLNMSDGILGDSLNIKFIGTFNTSVNNIDKALKRKGRLKIMHELKELNKDKVQKLFDKLGITEEAKTMPLCDVYNYAIDNGAKQQTKKIGF